MITDKQCNKWKLRFPVKLKDMSCVRAIVKFIGFHFISKKKPPSPLPLYHHGRLNSEPLFNMKKYNTTGKTGMLSRRYTLISNQNLSSSKENQQEKS